MQQHIGWTLCLSAPSGMPPGWRVELGNVFSCRCSHAHLTFRNRKYTHISEFIQYLMNEMDSNDVEHWRGRLQSRLGGIVEQQIGILSAHFQYLALLLYTYGKHCPNIDHFVWKLQSLGHWHFWWILPKRNIAPRLHSAHNTHVGGATSSHKTEHRSHFHFPNIAVWKSIHPTIDHLLYMQMSSAPLAHIILLKFKCTLLSMSLALTLIYTIRICFKQRKYYSAISPKSWPNSFTKLG